MKKPHWTYEETEQLRHLAGAFGSAEIGRRLGRSAKSVREQAHRMGVSLRCYGERHYSGKYADSFVMDIQDQHDRGAGASKLARRHGLPRETIRNFLSGRRGMGYEADLKNGTTSTKRLHTKRGY